MNKVAALFGMGSDTQVVALDVNTTISSQSKCTPSAADIIAAAAISTDSLSALQAPTLSRVLQSHTKRGRHPA